VDAIYRTSRSIHLFSQSLNMACITFLFCGNVMEPA
jgi:hypothetical protein